MCTVAKSNVTINPMQCNNLPNPGQFVTLYIYHEQPKVVLKS
jgi:hypothetical protein